MKKITFLGLFVFLICFASVSATVVEEINITQVQANVSSVGCDQEVRFSARVKDTFLGTKGINTVKFKIMLNSSIAPSLSNFVWFEAELVSGNATDGIWAYDLSPDPSIYGDINSFYLDTIYVESSASSEGGGSAHCSADDNLGPSLGCEVEFGSPRLVVNNCSCEATKQIGDCTIYNIKEVTWSIPAGCSDILYAGFNESCDYCDPLWTSDIAECNIVGYLKMEGVANRSYYSPSSATFPNGSYCCPETASAAGNVIFNHDGGSDCTPPPDTYSRCVLDSWLQYGDYASSNRNVISDSGERYGFKYSDMISVTGGAGTSFQPLVFDIDNDGYNEIVIAGSSSLYVYSITSLSSGLMTLEDSISVGGTIAGPIALTGVRKDIGGNYWLYDEYTCVDLASPPCNAFIVVPVDNGGGTKDIKVYQYDGSLLLNKTITLPIVSGQTYLLPNAGVACYDEYCYASGYDSGNYKLRHFKINIYTGSVTYVSHDGTSGFVDPSFNVPVLGDNVVVFYYKDSPSTYGISMYDYNLVSESQLTGSGNISGVVVVNDVVYYTFIYNTSSTYYFVLGKFDGVNSDFYSLWSGSSLGNGCVSNPVVMSCGAVSEVGQGQDIGVITYGPPTMTWFCNGTFTGWSQYTLSPVTSNLVQVRTLPNGKAFAYGEGHYVIYNNNVWTEISAPSSSLTLDMPFVNLDRTYDGRILLFFGNDTNTRILEYDFATGFVLYDSLDIGHKGPYVCTYDNLENRCYVSFNKTLYEVYPAFVKVNGSSYSISFDNGLIFSNYNVMREGHDSLYQRIYEWNGVSWVQRASIFYGGHDITHFFRDTAHQVLTYNKGGGANEPNVGLYWYNASLGTYATSFSGTVHVVKAQDINGDLHFIDDNIYSVLWFSADQYDLGLNGVYKINDMDVIGDLGWAVGDGGIIYRYSTGCNNVSIQLSGSQARCFSSDTLSPRTAFTLQGQDCKVGGGITASDIDSSASWENIFSGAGIIDFGNGVVRNLSDQIIVPVDVNGDLWGDIILANSSSTSVLISRAPSNKIISTGIVEVTALSPCSVGSNGMLQLGIWGTGSDPESIVYYMNPGDGTGTKTQAYGDGLGYYFTHYYQQPGTFTVTGKICDSSLGQCDENTCVVEVNITDTRAGTCTWYQAGSFDYVDDVEEYDWFVSPTTKILKPEDGLLKFTDGLDTEMLHTASCNQVGIKVSFKFYTDADGEFIITIGGDGGALASLKFRSGEILSYTSRDYVVVGNYSVNQWNVYKLAIDSSTNTFYIMDESDNIIFSDSLLRAVSDMYEAYVKLSYYSGNVYIDYIDLEGFGGIAFVSLEQDIANMTSEYSCSEGASILDQCSASTDLFFQAKRQGVPEQSYHNVNQFCSSCGKSGGTCDYSMLKRILNYNQDCYKEVMNYCVDVTYPRYTLKKDPSSGSVKEGTVVCSSVLGIYTASDKFIIPIFTTVWSVIEANFIYFAIVIIIIVVVLAIFANRK